MPVSMIGTAIRNNADLHKAIYWIVSDLAAAHMTRQDIGRMHFEYLCRLAASSIPHLPPPESGD